MTLKVQPKFVILIEVKKKLKSLLLLLQRFTFYPIAYLRELRGLDLFKITAERVVTRWVNELLFSVVTFCFLESGCSSSDEKSDKEEAMTTFFASETNIYNTSFEIDTQ